MSCSRVSPPRQRQPKRGRTFERVGIAQDGDRPVPGPRHDEVDQCRRHGDDARQPGQGAALQRIEQRLEPGGFVVLDLDEHDIGGAVRVEQMMRIQDRGGRSELRTQLRHRGLGGAARRNGIAENQHPLQRSVPLFEHAFSGGNRGHPEPLDQQ